jgi:hypothetical protein
VGSDKEGDMNETHTPEYRQYRAETRMYEVARLLGDDLHQIEHRIDELRARVHELVCESGRIPIEQKTDEVLGLIARFIGEVDFSGISEEGREIATLKAEADECEHELAVVPVVRHEEPVAIAG